MNFTYRPTPISVKTALMAVAFGLLVGAVLIFATGNNPIVIYAALLRGACGSMFALASSIRWTVPLIFAGVAASIAFKGGVFNMGVEGQMYMGGLAAAIVGITFRDLPGYVLIPFMFLASMLVGMIWALPPILAKLYYGSSEVVPCMMLNYVAMYLTDYLVHNVFLASGNRGATIKTDMIAVSRQFRLCVRGTGIRAACPCGRGAGIRVACPCGRGAGIRAAHPCGRGAGIRTMGILPVYLCFLYIFFLYTI